MPENIKIKSNTGEYEVSFQDDLSFCYSIFKDENYFYVLDKKVFELYRSNFKELNLEKVVLIDAIEENKDLSKIPNIIKELTDKGLKRNHTLMAIGGGITQDITCFISSIIFRGIDWHFIPTTLLAQSDSCIGSKSSINCSDVKNLVGNFYPPKKIFLSLEFLNTLTKNEMLSGVGEIVKVHMVKGLDKLELIVQEFDKIMDLNVLHKFIYNALLFKKELIEIDEYDRGPRNIMNYGHTFGHAIEKATDHKIPHGIAVAMGMDMANLYSFKFNHAGEKSYSLSTSSLKILFQNFSSVKFDKDIFFQAIRKDKKNIGNNITLIIPKGDSYKLSKEGVPFNNQFQEYCTDYFSNFFTNGSLS